MNLDLFTDPFTRPKAYNQPLSDNRSTTISRPKTAATQTPPDHQVAQPTQPKPVTAQVPQTSNVPEKPATPVKAPAPQEKAKTPELAPAKEQEQKTIATKPAPAEAAKLADTQPEPPKKALELDMSSGSGTAPAADDVEKRKAHEAAEAKRKAEWEAKQAAKKQSEEAALQKLQDMSDEEAITASVKRVSMETERLTHRNMKECVAEHIQELCRKDTAFARKTMHPRKNMVKCFKYITRMAKEYVKQEMEDNDINPDGGGYGCDVPDGLCYQWAEEYFNATDAPEDQEKEEKFIPKPYASTPSKSAKKKETKPKKQQNTQSDGYAQMSLEGVIG